MTDLLAQFHALPAVSLPAFALVAVAGLLMEVAPSSLPLVSVVVGSVAGQGAPEARPAGRRGIVFAAAYAGLVAPLPFVLGNRS